MESLQNLTEQQVRNNLIIAQSLVYIFGIIFFRFRWDKQIQDGKRGVALACVFWPVANILWVVGWGIKACVGLADNWTRREEVQAQGAPPKPQAPRGGENFDTLNAKLREILNSSPPQGGSSALSPPAEIRMVEPPKQGPAHFIHKPAEMKEVEEFLAHIAVGYDGKTGYVGKGNNLLWLSNSLYALGHHSDEANTNLIGVQLLSSPHDSKELDKIATKIRQHLDKVVEGKRYARDQGVGQSLIATKAPEPVDYGPCFIVRDVLRFPSPAEFLAAVSVNLLGRNEWRAERSHIRFGHCSLDSEQVFNEEGTLIGLKLLESGSFDYTEIAKVAARINKQLQG